MSDMDFMSDMDGCDNRFKLKRLSHPSMSDIKSMSSIIPRCVGFRTWILSASTCCFRIRWWKEHVEADKIHVANASELCGDEHAEDFFFFFPLARGRDNT